MKLRISGLAAGALSVLACATPALAAPTVSVRVEGRDGTLLERTPVTLDAATPAPGNGCPGDSAAAAIEAGTQGDWDRQVFTQRILGETHKFDDSDYWAEWLDTGGGYRRGGGICDDRLSDGDEVLMLVDLSPPPSYAPTVFPLAVEGLPSQVERGQSVTVTVVEYRSETGGTGEGTRTPVQGATVAGGAVTATTAADGTATLTFADSGAFTVKATKSGDAPSAGVRVSVREPGTTPAPEDGSSTGAPQPGAPAPAGRDTGRPVGRVLGIAEQAVFSRAKAPRELRIAATDPSGIAQVKLRLRRRHRGDCAYFSGRRERFVASPCGRSFAFKASEKGEFSYLLPGRLRPGRYVLDVVAIDRAFNRDRLARGRSRIVFTVR
ncbi:MAG TPA: hypothetical protein VF533_06155 [Solirubrobacteraceae bacterium]|jgi:hypothetical protein